MSTPFKLNYAPGFRHFKNLAGEDPVDQLRFMHEHGFRAIEDNRMMDRPVGEQLRIGKRKGGGYIRGDGASVEISFPETGLALEQVECEIDGRRWVQKPFPYQAKCLRWLREARATLASADRRTADSLLAGSGCEALFQDA